MSEDKPYNELSPEEQAEFVQRLHQVVDGQLAPDHAGIAPGIFELLSIVPTFMDALYDEVQANKKLAAMTFEDAINSAAFMQAVRRAAARLDDKPSSNLGMIPNTPLANLIYKAGAKSNYNELIDKNTTVTLEDGKLIITQRNPNNGTTAIISMTNPDAFFGNHNVSFLKMMTFALEKLVSQHFPLAIGFSLQELIDLKMYTAISSAWRAVKNFYEQQKAFELSGTLKKGNKLITESGGGLFYNYERTGNYVQLAFNQNFNIDLLSTFLTPLPRFAYRLNGNAFLLTRYIFYIARQRTEQIKAQGRFNINMAAIRDALGLPTTAAVKHRKYKQFIIDPVENAIEEIEVALATVPEAQDYKFTITPYNTNTSNINEWLDGYLEICLDGDFSKTFIEIAKSKETRRARIQQQKIREIAKLQAKKEASSNDKV